MRLEDLKEFPDLTKAGFSSDVDLCAYDCGAQGPRKVWGSERCLVGGFRECSRDNSHTRSGAVGPSPKLMDPPDLLMTMAANVVGVLSARHEQLRVWNPEMLEEDGAADPGFRIRAPPIYFLNYVYFLIDFPLTVSGH